MPGERSPPGAARASDAIVGLVPGRDPAPGKALPPGRNAADLGLNCRMQAMVDGTVLRDQVFSGCQIKELVSAVARSGEELLLLYY